MHYDLKERTVVKEELNTAVRRAEWRSLLEDERSGYVKAIPRLLAPTVLFGIAFVILNVLRLDALLVLFAAAFVWHFGSGKGERGHLHNTPSSALALHTSWPMIEGSFPVRVVYLRYFEPLRHDEAIAAFADEWLFVDGLRARFSLRLEDAFVTFPADGVVAFDFPYGERVELQALDSMEVGNVTARAFCDRFDVALRAWCSTERRGKPLD